MLTALRTYCGRRQTHIVERQQFIASEMRAIISATKSRGATPNQTLSRVLQQLRDEGLVEFLSAGRYFLLEAPINIEEEELPDEAIDIAIRANKLRIGVVATNTRLAVVRQRRGQARLRSLTVENYGLCCAVCDVAEMQLLIASHIVGWAEAPEHRGNLTNVICLCRFHDALFERHYWSLDDSLRILKNKSAESRTIRLLLDEMSDFRSPAAHAPAGQFVRIHRTRSSLTG